MRLVCFFISYLDRASKFAFFDLKWLNFILTYLVLRCFEACYKCSSCFLESVELLSRLGSMATVIIFLQMLEFGRWEKEGNIRKTSCLQHYFHPSTWSQLLLTPRYPPLHTHTRTHPLSKLYTSCLSLYPRRQPGQAVFTAEVIGVVWREPDPGPAKA